MLQLTQTEIFSSRSSAFKNTVFGQLQNRISQNSGIIQPYQIELPLSELKKYAKTKSASSPCLLPAIDLYENYGGRIQLFDFTVGNDFKSPIPSFFPFLPAKARRPDGQNAIPAIFVNLYKLGRWSLDEKSYEDIYAITDLHTCLESGYIAYKMIIENKADDILSSTVVIENLTRLYTKLFYDALIKVPGNLPLLDFQQEAGKFMIAKFFIKYVLQRPDPESSINTYARLAANANSSVTALQTYEDNLGINYERLSTFLSSFGLVFFNGHPTTITEFEKAWIQMYGEGLAFAIEYVPYLIHFLFAPIHASRLGGSSRLDKRYPNLQKEGLIKLYNALLSGVLK